MKRHLLSWTPDILWVSRHHSYHLRRNLVRPTFSNRTAVLLTSEDNPSFSAASFPVHGLDRDPMVPSSTSLYYFSAIAIVDIGLET